MSEVLFKMHPVAAALLILTLAAAQLCLRLNLDLKQKLLSTALFFLFFTLLLLFENWRLEAENYE